MPGDFCDMHVAVLDEMDHTIATLTEARVAQIGRAEMEHMIDSRPSITRAFWRTQIVDESVLRAWIVSMGRRNAQERPQTKAIVDANRDAMTAILITRFCRGFTLLGR